MFNQFGIPGQSAAVFNTTNEFLWGGDVTRIPLLHSGVVISGAARDLGATPTTVLREGLIMGQIASSGLYKEYSPTATDGSQVPVGILRHELVMVDPITGENENKAAVLVVQAPLKARVIYVLGVSLVGHAAEYLVRQQLANLGFKLDDDLAGYKSGLNRRITTKATAYTVVAADNGTLFQGKTADTAFTLPALQVGLRFTFQQTADFLLSVASAEGGNVVVGNDLSANSVTFTAAGNQIGAQIYVEGMYVDGTAKWVFTLPYIPFNTGLNTLTFAIAT